MLVWLKRFFMDETAFVGLARGTLMGFGVAEMSGTLDPYLGELPDIVGIMAVAAGGFIRSTGPHIGLKKKDKPE